MVSVWLAEDETNQALVDKIIHSLEKSELSEENTVEEPSETVEDITEVEETEVEKKAWTQDMEVVFYINNIKEVYSWDEETGWIKMERYSIDTGHRGLTINEYWFISSAFKENADILFPELEEFYPKTDIMKGMFYIDRNDDMITYTNGEEYYEARLILGVAVIEKKDGAVIRQYYGSEAAELVHKFVDTYIIDEEKEATIEADVEAYKAKKTAEKAANKS